MVAIEPRQPRGVGDALLLVVLPPLGAAALTFLFLIPVTLVAAIIGLDIQSPAALAWAGVPAVAVTVSSFGGGCSCYTFSN